MMKLKNTKSKILIISTVILILILSYFGYYKYQQSKLVFKAPEGFSVESDTSNIRKVGEEWLDKYISQYQRKYVARNKKINSYAIDSIEVKEENIIQINFLIEPEQIDEEIDYNLNGIIKNNKISIQWVLWFEEEELDEETIFTVKKIQRPAGYDLEKYQASGEKERDEYENEHVTEIPYGKKQYTYKIEDQTCYVSYDGGTNWIELPISLETLVETGDGNDYYNQLQEGSYIVSPEKTAFVYGGNRENPLMITYSQDMGKTFETTIIDEKIDSNRVKFLSFPTDDIGYVVASAGRTMSQEVQVIYKSTDGGHSFKEIGFGPSTWLIQSAGFIDENIGFISYPGIEGAETNFYRTEDGGSTFEPIILPTIEKQWMDASFEPFIQPEMPYEENGELFLLVNQGSQGDYLGGRIKAKLKSEDKGKTWEYIGLVEPHSEELG